MKCFNDATKEIKLKCWREFFGIQVVLNLPKTVRGNEAIRFKKSPRLGFTFLSSPRGMIEVFVWGTNLLLQRYRLSAFMHYSVLQAFKFNQRTHPTKHIKGRVLGTTCMCESWPACAFCEVNSDGELAPLAVVSYLTESDLSGGEARRRLCMRYKLLPIKGICANHPAIAISCHLAAYGRYGNFAEACNTTRCVSPSPASSWSSTNSRFTLYGSLPRWLRSRNFKRLISSLGARTNETPWLWCNSKMCIQLVLRRRTCKP